MEAPEKKRWDVLVLGDSRNIAKVWNDLRQQYDSFAYNLHPLRENDIHETSDLFDAIYSEMEDLRKADIVILVRYSDQDYYTREQAWAIIYAYTYGAQIFTLNVMEETT